MTREPGVGMLSFQNSLHEIMKFYQETNIMKKTLSELNLEDVKLAREVISSVILPTSMRKVLCKVGSQEAEIFVKLESQQLTGSFKIRGALNKMNSLTKEERQRGVIAASAGNHAQGVAYSATLLGIRSVIVMPETSPLVKVTATQNYGAEVILHGDYFDIAFQRARELEKEKGYTFVHPYEDPYVIAGQGTIGLEILESLPDVENVVVPIGGGGLISGIAMVLKALRPNIRVIGVVSAAAPGMRNLFDKQIPIIKKSATIADGIAVKNPSPEMYKNFISKYVDEIVEVTDEEIALAMVFLLEKMKALTEGSGAAGFAAVLSDKVKLTGKTCVLLCGGNVDLNTLSRVIETGLRKAGRLARISVVVDDLPGNLSRLTNVIASSGANILEVFHDRVSQDLHLRETKIDFVLEIKSRSHLDSILEELSTTLGTRLCK